MSLLPITIESLLSLFQNTAIPHLIGRNALVIIRIHFILFSILVIVILTNPGSCDQHPIVLIFSIREFRKCVTVIFSIFAVYDIIFDSGIRNTEVSAYPEVPEDQDAEASYYP